MTDFATRRRMMVDTQVRPSDVTKFPIIDAMLRIPREAFVPDSEREAAYAGRNVRLAENRVVLEPRTLAKMLDAVNIDNDDLVLDIGAGFGYSSAVIARIAEAVVAVEEPTFLYRRSLGLAAEFGLGSTYDALYLALAESEGCEMWTADLRLCRAVDDRFSLLRCLGL